MLINNGFIVRNDVDNEIAVAVAQELVSLSKSQQGLKLLDNAGFEGFEFADNSDYDIVATFLEKYDAAIGIPK